MIQRDVINSLEQLIVEALLPPEARSQYAAGDIAHAILKPYAEAIARMSARYVSRTAIAPLSVEEAAAYALYYTPVNAAKIWHLLGRIPPEVWRRPHLTILDYGCGPATASLAASFMAPAAEILAVDAVGPMRQVAHRLLESRARTAPLRWKVAEEFSGTFDVIIAANVLNELSTVSATNLIDRFIGALSPDGVLLTLEPALLETTRNHMALRDELLARHHGVVPLFPCTHSAPCPMLSLSPTEWCHAPLVWEEPRLLRQLDELTGFNKHRPKFSAFVFTRTDTTPPGIRIVRGAEKTNRGASALGCGPNFFGELTLLKRNKSEENRVFLKVDTYDRIEVIPPPQAGLIEAHARVEIRDDARAEKSAAMGLSTDIISR